MDRGRGRPPERRLRKSSKNNRRDFAHLGSRPNLRDHLPTSAIERGASRCLIALLKLMTLTRLFVRPKAAWKMLACGNTRGYELLAAGELEI